MNVEIRKSFVKDTNKLSAATQIAIATLIDEIEKTQELSDLSNCKKLKGFANAYRIRLGQYRVGFFYENQTLELVRILERKDIYRYFP